MKKFYFTCLIFFLNPLMIFPQSKLIHGFVYNLNNNNPIQFASIYFEENHEGTITNSEGLFSIKKSKECESLLISCIGFNSKNIKLTSLNDDSLSIGLMPEIYSIDEISITALSPLEVIKKTITSKKSNYPNKPTIINGYYKQITKQNNEYVRFSEADLRIYRESYTSTNKKDEDKIQVINALSTKDKVENILYETFVLADMLKASKFVFDTNYIKNYTLKIYTNPDSILSSNYLVTVRPIENKGQLWANIYVDKTSFSIVAINIKKDLEMLLYDEKLAKKFKYKDKPALFYTAKSFNYLITYKKIDKKWHLNYIHADNEIVAYNNTDTVKFNDQCDFLVSTIESENVEEFRKKTNLNNDLYSIGITNKELFENPNKIINTKDEEIIRRRNLGKINIK